MVNVEMESQMAGMINIQLVDLHGIARSEQLARIAAGVNKLVLPTSGLASGHYHVVLRSESSSLSRAFTIVR
jgi:hypothetical protein